MLLIAAVIFAVFLFSRSPRLERGPDACAEAAKPAVRAFVDGKPVKSYLKESSYEKGEPAS